MKPKYLVGGLPIWAIVMWLEMLGSITTWDAFLPVHLAWTLGYMIIGIGGPCLVVMVSHSRDEWEDPDA